MQNLEPQDYNVHTQYTENQLWYVVCCAADDHNYKCHISANGF